MYDQQLPSYPGYPPTQSGACPMPMPTISQNQLRNNLVTSQNSVLSDVSIFSGMLRGKSSDDLQAILHNESKIISMIGEVDEVRKINSNIQTLTASNQSLADSNLRKKPDLETRISNLKQHQEKYKILRDEFTQRMQSLGSHRIDLDTISALLKASVAQNEEEAETLADAFMDGRISVENFVNEFLEKRKEVHLRMVKSEKLVNIISQGGSQTQW